MFDMQLLNVPFALAGGALFMLYLYIARESERKMKKFVAILDDPYIIDENSLDPHVKPVLKKYAPKIMLYSMFKYLGFLFLMIILSTIHIVFTAVLAPAYLISGYYTIRYMKLWKYHGYSVLLLILLSVIAIAAGAIVSPFVREFIWQGINIIGRKIFG